MQPKRVRAPHPLIARRLACALGAVVWVAVASAFSAPAAGGPTATAPATRPASGWAGRVVPVTGRAVGGLESFDKLMTSFLASRDVPGGALAVARGGRLVYARGFGYADRRPAPAPSSGARPALVQPDSLFRIASISKPITAAAVLQLVDRRKWKLTDRAFDRVKLPAHLPDGAKPDAHLASVTLDHLLYHTGGWDRGRSGDPMFRSVSIAKALGLASPPGPDAIVRYMQGRPIDFAPGERVCYSNFGYCALGRAIEAVTGRPYEEYVRKNVLAPLGIRRMRIGRTLRAKRSEGEVCYFSRNRGLGKNVFAGQSPARVARPYGTWCLESMDAHGAWIASAVDLLRFACALDDPKRCRILSADSVAALWARPPGRLARQADGSPKAVYYARGWLVRQVGGGKINTWHTGGLPGTATLLVRRHDGLNWAVLFNTDADAQGRGLTGQIDPMVHVAARAVRAWPAGDLFDSYR